ncbi:DUF294 nucleotidyltransferase-like domain-containing protein [Oerskovia sp. M15]
MTGTPDEGTARGADEPTEARTHLGCGASGRDARGGPAAERAGQLGVSRRSAVCALVTDRLTTLWDEATAGASTEGIALAAVGSLGREDMGPASDLDLVLVHDGRSHSADQVAALAQRLWYPCGTRA